LQEAKSFEVYDLEDEAGNASFALSELPRFVEKFAFITGQR